MDIRKTSKQDWRLTEEGLSKLLSLLDADTDRAGRKYEAIRLKLMGFFYGRGCAFPDELADATMDRVAKKIERGEQIEASEPYAYFRGVANKIFLEYLKRIRPVPIELVSAIQIPKEDPRRVEQEKDYLDEQAYRKLCMRQCYEGLKDEKRLLIEEFEQGQKTARINNRKKIAERLRINLNALRIRVFKIRKELRTCRDNCLKTVSGEK